MRFLACTLVFSTCLLMTTGCGLFSKSKSSSSLSRAPAGSSAGPVATASLGNVGSPQPGSILAGRVLDNYHRTPPGSTAIQVVALTEDNRPTQSSREIATDQQGFFTIPDLQSGRHYRLVARVQDGSRLLTGTTYAMAPDPRVVIRVSDDLKSVNTPPLPPSPAWQPPPTTAPGIPPPAPPPSPGSSAGSTWNTPAPEPPPSFNTPLPGQPGSGDSASRGQPFDLGPPVRGLTPSAATEVPQAIIRPEDIAQGAASLPGRESPILTVPPRAPVAPPTPPQPRQQSNAWPAPGQPMSAAVAPSCQLIGRKLENFALNDLNGGTWEFRQHRGRLVLLDFWGTWCRPCLGAIPHLRAMQQLYGPQGLEVVGIAYESGTLQEQTQKVRAVRDRLGINYRVLLGAGMNTCPVKSKFQVAGYPTLVLLDENGNILWRGEGADRAKLQALEGIIKQRLRGY